MLYAAAIVAAIFAAAAAFRVTPTPAPGDEPYDTVAAAPAVESTPQASPADQNGAAGSDRLVYRHSVVPGGVFSDGELRAAMRNDPVVASHFTTLGRTRLRTEIVPHDRMVYVSYRKGGQVYWTRNKVLLRAGETILTDGRTQIRTRCGNCISDTPVTPVAADEPEVVEFDALVADPAEETAEVEEAPVEETGPAVVAGGGGPVAVTERAAPAGAAPYVFPATAPFVRWGGIEAAVEPTTEQPTTPDIQTAADDPPPTPPVDDPPAANPPADDPPAEDPPVDNPPPPDDIPEEPEINPVPVPEPSTYLLVGGGIAALLRRMRARNGKRAGPRIDG
jgi:hypothetical protein